GVMNDLYVATEGRGTGVAEALIEACRAQCAARGAGRLTWQTAPDNQRAMKVYERVGAMREQWIDYWLPAPPEGEHRRGARRGPDRDRDTVRRGGSGRAPPLPGALSL